MYVLFWLSVFCLHNFHEVSCGQVDKCKVRCKLYRDPVGPMVADRASNSLFSPGDVFHTTWWNCFPESQLECREEPGQSSSVINFGTVFLAGDGNDLSGQRLHVVTVLHILGVSDLPVLLPKMMVAWLGLQSLRWATCPAAWLLWRDLWSGRHAGIAWPRSTSVHGWWTAKNSSIQKLQMIHLRIKYRNMNW